MRTILVFLLFVSAVFSQDCVLDVSDPESPFIVTDELGFPIYADIQNQTFNFSNEDTFYVVCPSGTHSPYLSESGDQVTCVEGTNLTNLNADHPGALDFANIKCKAAPGTIVVNTGDECATSGTLFEIGFNVSSKFLTSITVCFDEALLTPIYCKYDYRNIQNVTFREFLPRSSDNYYQSYICNGTACDWVDSGSVYGDVNIDTIYSTQQEIFTALEVNSDNVTVLRFPLATTTLWYLNVVNDGQEIQKVPYYDYISVVPVWDSEMLEVWFYMIDTNVSPTGNSSLYAGTLGIATLNSTAGDAVPIYLTEDDTVPVPQWLWVILNTNEEVLFYYNSPNSEESTEAIKGVCTEHVFMSPAMYRCTYDQINNTVINDIIENEIGVVDTYNIYE